MISTRIEIGLDDFYATDGPMLFIDKMAAFLMIPTNKLRIVRIIEGSTLIDYEVFIDEDTKKTPLITRIMSEYSISANVPNVT